MQEFKVGDRVKYGEHTGTVTGVYKHTDYGIDFDGERHGWVVPDVDVKLHNPPLTVQDLAGMDGERVWVVDKGKMYEPSWHVVSINSKSLIDNNGASYLMCRVNCLEDICAYRHKPERIDTMNNEPKNAPNYEAMYHDLLVRHEHQIKEIEARTKAQYCERIQKLQCENDILKQCNEVLERQLTKSQSDQATLFSKVEIYEFCVRAFTGMGEKKEVCGCKE